MTIRSTISALALAGTALAGTLAGTLGALPATAQATRAAGLAQLRAEFAASDVNHDGVLTRAEVSARIAHMKMAGAAHPLSRQQADELTALWFQRTDANHDGRVTLAESEATMAQMFDRYDTNHDGVISPAERAAAKHALTPPATRR